MQLWSAARYDLRLTDEEFFALTPRQFNYLIRRHRYKVESTELLFAQLTAFMVNTAFRAPKEPADVKEFMPSEWAKRGPAPAPSTIPKFKKRRRRAVIAQEIRGVMAAFMRS